MKRKRLAIFAGVVVLQMAGLYALENELTPATAKASFSTTAGFAQNQLSKQAQQPKLTPPDDAVLCDIDPHGDALAYLNRHDQLVVQNRTGQATAVTHLEGVNFLQWLDTA